MTTTLTAFLLFSFDGWITYGNMILHICTLTLYPVFVFALLFDQASSKPNPTAILKRLIIAQIVLLAIPTYYKKTVDFGFNVGDSILSTQKTGLIGNWNKIQKGIGRKIKEAQKKKRPVKGDPPGILEKVAGLFMFNGMDLVEKAAAILIFICILLIKIIYSLVYYATYCTVGIMATLSVFPFFSGHLMGAVKSVLYLILTAIIVALVLTFMNSAIQFNVSGDGFLKGLFGISKFIVLCFVLLGSLKISQSLVNGIGAEGWAGNMGSMLGAGLAFKTMGMAKNITGATAQKGAMLALKTLGGPTGAMIAGAGYMATRPLAMIGKSMKNSVGSTANALNLAHSPKDYLGNNHGRDFENGESGDGNSLSSMSSSMSLNNLNNLKNSKNDNGLLKGRYENSFNKVVGDKNDQGIKQALNPINHLKSSMVSTKGLYRDVLDKSKNKIGLPKFSKKLTMSQKTAFVANKLVNGGALNLANKAKLTPQEQRQRKLTINRINKAMRGNNV